MKVRLRLLGLAAAMCIAGNAFAQDFSGPEYANYGDTPEQRQENVAKYSFLREAFQLKQYEEASVLLQDLLKGAPKVSQNLYIMGATIYRDKIEKATTPDQKKVMLDSLFLIYDARLANFGDDARMGKGYIVSEKAKDYITYYPDDVAGITNAVKAAVDAAPGKADVDLVHVYFNLLAEGYKAGTVTIETLLNDYDYLATALGETNNEQAQQVLDQLFVQSGAASCENLEKIFKPQFEANPDDKDLVVKISRYLTREDCKSDFRAQVAEQYYKLEPTADAAISIARTFQQSQDYERAMQFYDEAINMETDAEKKSDYALTAASTAMLAENYRKAADYAKTAIANNADNGLAYFLLGQAYGQGSTGCSGFDRQTVYWLAVDNLSKARTLLEDQPDQLKNVVDAINAYSANFPSAEEVFFRTLTPGDGYTVSCGWISGRTTVRERR